MSNLYILTSFLSAVTAFSFLFVRSKLKVSSQISVLFASGLGAICLFPFLINLDFSNFSQSFCLYVVLAGLCRLLSMIVILEVVKKTSVERFSAVNPLNIFMSFLIFSVIDYSNTMILIQSPFKFFGILGSIIGIVMVLVSSKKDKKFMETLKIFFPGIVLIGLCSSFIRLSKLNYVGDIDLEYNIFMNFMLFFVPFVFLLPFQIKEVKSVNIKMSECKLLFVFCVLFFLDRCLVNISYAISPNPGYAIAINNSVIILLAFLKDKFVNVKKENNMVTVMLVLFFALSMIYFTNI